MTVSSLLSFFFFHVVGAVGLDEDQGERKKKKKDTQNTFAPFLKCSAKRGNGSYLNHSATLLQHSVCTGFSLGR